MEKGVYMTECAFSGWVNVLVSTAVKLLKILYTAIHPLSVNQCLASCQIVSAECAGLFHSLSNTHIHTHTEIHGWGHIKNPKPHTSLPLFFKYTENHFKCAVYLQ